MGTWQRRGLVVLALAVGLLVAGCANKAPSAASPPPEGYTTDPGAAKGDPFGYDGRKWRNGLGG